MSQASLGGSPSRCPVFNLFLSLRISSSMLSRLLSEVLALGKHVLFESWFQCVYIYLMLFILLSLGSVQCFFLVLSESFPFWVLLLLEGSCFERDVLPPQSDASV